LPRPPGGSGTAGGPCRPGAPAGSMCWADAGNPQGGRAMSAASFIAQGSSDQVLPLFLAQPKDQDPLSPTDSSQFTSQLAQFSTLEGITKLNANFADLLTLQQLTGGSSLIGKTVSFDQAGSPTPGQGTVTAITVDNGKINLTVN